MSTTELMPCLIDVRGAAKMLAISERNVWRLLKDGQIPSPVHIGRTTRWRVEDLSAYIAGLAGEAKEIQPGDRCPPDADARPDSSANVNDLHQSCSTAS